MVWIALSPLLARFSDISIQQSVSKWYLDCIKNAEISCLRRLFIWPTSEHSTTILRIKFAFVEFNIHLSVYQEKLIQIFHFILLPALQHQLYKSLGSCLILADPPENERLSLLNEVNVDIVIPGRGCYVTFINHHCLAYRWIFRNGFQCLLSPARSLLLHCCSIDEA